MWGGTSGSLLFSGTIPGQHVIQDNTARSHRARSVMSTQNGVNHIQWPALSSDHNPIEHVCDLLGSRVYSHQPRLTTLDYLRRKEMFYLTTHSTHFIYGYMASDIW